MVGAFRTGAVSPWSWVRIVVCVVAALALLVWWLAGASAALASGWSIQSFPAHGVMPSAVSCVSQTACTAVGVVSHPGTGSAAFAARWDGRRWSTEPMPNPAGAEFASLLAADA